MVDTKTVELKVHGEGNEKVTELRQYHFLVLGDPCTNPEKISETFESPFSGQTISIKTSAPDVNCDSEYGVLNHGTRSDHGHIIVGMIFGDDTLDGPREDAPVKEIDADKNLQDYCKVRTDRGYSSGMGLIFRKVAEAAPITRNWLDNVDFLADVGKDDDSICPSIKKKKKRKKCEKCETVTLLKDVVYMECNGLKKKHEKQCKKHNKQVDKVLKKQNKCVEDYGLSKM